MSTVELADHLESTAPKVEGPRRVRPPGRWLFSARVDLAAFLGSALAALAALWIGARAGVLHGDTPDWAWVPAILLIDVAHVWATGFRVYLDTDEFKRRPLLYSLVPVFGFCAGVALYSEGEVVFWRTLAYLAVFHFIRQQYGWVALYRARLGETGRLGRCIDTSAIYLATLYPLIYWHCHLPRNFRWFFRNDFAALPEIIELPRAFRWFFRNDFASLPEIVERLAEPIYWTALGAYALRSAYLWLIRRAPNPGKDIVVVTTAVCWYVGIVAFNSDYAFTVTNVIIHGVPYLVLVYWYRTSRGTRAVGNRWNLVRGLTTFLATLWLIAYVEELFWDRCVWHEHGWLFGESWNVGSWKLLLVPLLALPQMTHYILDGFIWRRRSNPDFNHGMRLS